MKPYLQIAISMTGLKNQAILPNINWTAVNFSNIGIMTDTNKFFTAESGSGTNKLVIPQSGTYDFIFTGKSSNAGINCFACYLDDGITTGQVIYESKDGSLYWYGTETLVFEEELNIGDKINFYVGGARHNSGQYDYDNVTLDGYLTIKMR